MSVNYSITQNFPVADHVYKYLITCCGSDHIVATRNDHIGSLVLSLQNRNEDIRTVDHKYTKIFKVTISESHYQKLGLHITPATAQLFNDQVDRKFRDELFRTVLLVKQMHRSTYLKSIRKFLDAYKIDEEDIKLDTLYRDFKRKKEDLKRKLNLTPSNGDNL